MLRLYNTLSRKIEEFKPINPPKVGIYTCGPTVYDFAHIGHARTYIFADLLRRTLNFSGFKVCQVMNVTDVGHLVSDADQGEDKIELAARRAGKAPWEIARFFENDFWQMLAKLNIEKPETIAHATDYIAEMITLVQVLQQKGYTYETSDGIYFDISKFPGYPKLGGFKLREQKPGVRVPVRGEKKNSHDFALWKKVPREDSGQAQPLQQWDSPWGRGFPGWHLECSVMSLKNLGRAFEKGDFYGDRSRTIDIHTGGVDHISIHHNNEIAQSEAATGYRFVKYWLHGQHLLVEGKKMAKSLKNFYRLADLEKRGFEPSDFRYLCLTVHYRTRLNFTWPSLKAAQSAFSTLKQEISSWEEPKIGCAEFEENFLKAIDDDLNLPQALAVVWELVKSDYPSHAKAASILKMDKILGLKFVDHLGKAAKLPAAIQKLMEKREELRKEDKWQEADKIRKELEEKGISLEDTSSGTIAKIK